jgi:hypothetical protein
MNCRGNWVCWVVGTVAALGSLTIEACSSSEDSHNSSPGSGCAEYERARAVWNERCGLVTPPESGLGAMIEEARVEYCVAASTAAGVKHDPSKMMACVDWMRTRPCAHTTTQGTRCAFRDQCGPRGPGEPCYRDRQCTSGLCSRSYEYYPDPFTCGTCVGPIAAGSPCQFGELCADGFVCLDGACQAIPGLGEHCYSTCIDGYACDQPTRTCVPQPQEGDPCDLSFDQCVPTTNCEDGICVKLAAEGEPCSGLFTCGGYFACESGVCVPVRQALPGEPCDFETPCLVGPCQKTCAAILDDGAACDPSDYRTTCGPASACYFGTCARLDPTICD